MKKKLMALLMVVCMLAMVTACGGKKNDKKADDQKTEVTQNDKQDEQQDVQDEKQDTPDDTQKQDETVDPSQAVTVIVRSADGTETTYYCTEEVATVRAAMDAIEELTYDGTESEWGFYLTTVNGEAADYDVDSSYWSLSVNDNYAVEGIDTQAVAFGDVVLLEYEKWEYVDDEGLDVEFQYDGVTLLITDNEGGFRMISRSTEATTVQAFMDELVADEDCEFSYDGYTSDWGYYLTTVNGLVADYDADGAYWSLLINDNYAEYGIDAQTIQSGDTITLAYTVYTE